MCGFVSVLRINAKNSPLDPEKILTSFKWRGPDDHGFWSDTHLSLYHNRLAILDLSKNGHQPMHSDCDRYVIAFNGEVYNWQEIRERLNFNQWKSGTDTETILQAYIEIGASFVKILNGMFSFVIWDKKEKTLFAARDRVGIKPLYFFKDADKIIYSSEIKPIFVCGVEKKINRKCLYDFLRWGLLDHDENTFFDNIYSLPAGTCVTFDLKNKAFKEQRYWEVPIDSNYIINNYSDTDVAKIYENLLYDSIQKQAIADVEVGVSLSGGIDSTVLTACLAEYLGNEKTTAFTYAFGNETMGEAKIAAETAKILGIKHHISVLKAGEVPELLKNTLYLQEAPVSSMRVLAHHKLFATASENNVKVLLEGSGGDELGAGYEYYYFPYIIDYLKNNNSDQAFVEINKFLDVFNIPKNERLLRILNVLNTTFQPGLATQDGVEFVKPGCLNYDFFGEQQAPQFISPFDDYLRNAQWIDFANVVLPKALRYTDRASMSSSCESRVPILDNRIIDLSFNASVDHRIGNGKQRIFMKEAGKKLLPNNVLNMPKQTIVDQQRGWLKDELQNWVWDQFNSVSARNIEFLNLKEIQKEYQKYLMTPNPPTSVHIWQYLNIINWYQVFFENE